MDNYDAYGERCGACGCFLGVIDISTESGYNFEFVCNNPKCKGAEKDEAIIIKQMGDMVEFFKEQGEVDG